MTADEYWDGPGIRFLNEDGTLPTVEERVKAGYCDGWQAGWDEACEHHDEQDKHRCNPEAGFLWQEVNLLKAEIERLREEANNWHQHFRDEASKAQKCKQAYIEQEKEVARLREELQDIKGGMKFIMDEKCAESEVHCACVPLLKINFKESEQEVARLRGLLKDHATFMRQNGFAYQAEELMRGYAPAPEEAR
jgi:hypothetical protein